MQHDLNITNIISKKQYKCYGMGLGVILFDAVFPAFPGDVRNASAFPYNIQYCVAEGVNNHTLIFNPDKDLCLKAALNAGKYLQDLGCKALIGECGYFGLLQKEMAAAFDIPVFMSSLLQVGWMQKILNPKQKVGIMCAHKNSLSTEVLNAVGIENKDSLIIAGTQDDYNISEFSNLWDDRFREIGHCDYAKAEQQFVDACKDFVAKNPNMAALVLECTGFPVFGRAIQRAVGIPVLSWSTLMDYANSITVHRDFYGHV